MPRWRRDNYLIVLYAYDHPPLHVHVFRDGRPIGRYDLEADCWLDEPVPRHRDRARRAVRGIAELWGDED